MYDDYDSVTPGKKVYTDEDLIKNILGFLKGNINLNNESYDDISQKYNYFYDKFSSKRVFDQIIKATR